MPHKDPIKSKQYQKEYYFRNRTKKLKARKLLYMNTPYDVRLAKNKYRKKNAEIIKVKKRDYVLRKAYGLSTEKYNEIFEKQNGKCAICNKHQKELSRPLNVDHCHNTNKIRDLLCDRCNLTVGYVENCNIDVILQYINKHRKDVKRWQKQINYKHPYILVHQSIPLKFQNGWMM